MNVLDCYEQFKRPSFALKYISLPMRNPGKVHAS